jgi:ribosomal protein S27AE
MARSASLECPDCGETEHPLRHTFGSRCGGVIYWHNGRLQCGDCGERISRVRCDECGSTFGPGAVD